MIFKLDRSRASSLQASIVGTSEGLVELLAQIPALPGLTVTQAQWLTSGPAKILKK